MKKKALIASGIILLLFIITNPSPTAFKSYLGVTGYYGLKRSSNLFIFSIYKHGNWKYLGIAGNFWWINEPIKRPQIFSDSDTTRKVDTTMAKMADTTKKWTPPKGDIEVKYDEYGIPIIKKIADTIQPLDSGLPVLKKDPLGILKKH
jgi:hypothetical protein